MNRHQLRELIAQREAELAHLKSQLAVVEAETDNADADADWKWPLERHNYDRYSRQMIVPKFGPQGQLRMNQARVLIVGAGGLGCPAAAYLAGAGVGVLGLVDGDVVEVSNLHRQIAHSTERVGMSKVASAIAYLKGLNPTIRYVAHETRLDAHNAADIVSQYDVVLDCTDHATSRYLVSDMCVLLNRPLVSAAALQTSGQLVVLNSPPGEGPCYRCVFPRPPPPDTVVGCGEGGVLGPVVGVMGVLQALAAMRLITDPPSFQVTSSGNGNSGSGNSGSSNSSSVNPSMLLFDGAAFRTVRIRGKRPGCFACAPDAGLTLAKMPSSGDYVRFCGVSAPVELLKPEERVSVKEYRDACANKGEHLLIDVRDKEHYDICHLEGSVNIPLGQLTADDSLEKLPPDGPIYFVCRVGNDSQIAARRLKDMGLDRNGRFIGDLRGGIKAWRDSIDPSLPFI